MSTAGTINEALIGISGVRHGHLRRTSATALQFIPWGGDRIKINGTWRTIPAGGVSIGNSGLAANTQYYVYLYWNGSALVSEFSGTGHSLSSSADNAGVEVKTGDESRSLIGFIRTDASSQFVDLPTARWVRSWFNRQLDKRVCNVVAGGQFSTNSNVPVNSGLQLDFLAWAGEAITASVFVSSWNSTVNTESFVGMIFRGAYTEGGHGFVTYSDASQNWNNCSHSLNVVAPADERITMPLMYWTLGGMYLGSAAVPPTLNARIG